MKLLFIHQNMPGQYRELIQWLAAQKEHEIVFLTQRQKPPEFAGVKTAIYATHHKAANDAYGLSKTYENAAGNGFGAAMAVRKILATGFRPDIVIGHVGWGEMTFLREVLPDTPLIGFFEYYYSVHGGPVGFDPADPPSEHAPFLMQGHNVVPLVNIDVVDLAHSPTEWQANRFPASFRDKMYVCHDGIRTDTLKPNKKAKVELGRIGRALTVKDEIVTFMARNLETTRGYHQFMRALPHIQKARPNARILVIGGNDASYGAKSKHSGGLRGQMEAEVGHLLDWDRLHFLGHVPFAHYQKIIQISSCHIYLSMPFVLSWSFLECMAMQATIVASDVAPVREAMEHGKTGLLVDFFDAEAIAAQVVEVLERPRDFVHLGPAAREHVVKTYDFHTVCLPEHIRQINALVKTGAQIRLP